LAAGAVQWLHVLQEARMAGSIRWMAAALVASLLAACASPTPRASTLAPGAGVSPQMVHVTGSQIAVPVDPHTGRPQTASPLQIVSQDDLRNTGYVDVGAALRQLVPALH
jgi:hypothetical protein